MERGKISLKYNAASADSRSYFTSQSHCLSLTMSGATASVDCTFDIGDLTEPAAFPDKKGSPWKTNNPTKSIIT